MGKMHEVLAVEPEVRAAADTILAESINTFSKKHDHFEAQSRKYSPTVDGGESFPDENKEMVTTVRERLDYTANSLIRLFDLTLQKESSNSEAKADLVLDGKAIATGLPAVFLLGLENKLKHIKQMYIAIPTLEPGEKWVPDVHQKYTYVADTKYSHRTNKVLKPVVLYPATDKHPAQVEKMTEDVRVGTWATTKYSGKLAPVEKAELLARVDKLIAAVKKARCRANDVESAHKEIGKKLFDFIHDGKA